MIEFGTNGLLPPYLGVRTERVGYSPHLFTLPEVVELLGYTGARRGLLRRLLTVRAELHAAGVRRGEQWLAGSFVERTELTRDREPQDLDLVTLFGQHDPLVYRRLMQRIPQFQDPAAMQERFGLDAYYFRRPDGSDDSLDDLLYWSAFFSHTTQNVWKGYVRVLLNPEEALDAQAVRDLNSRG